MKCLLLLLALRLVTSDTLDRTYLPPPGANFAGGNSDILQIPLEYPKQTYPGPTQNDQLPDNFNQNDLPGPHHNNQGFSDMTLRPTVPIDYSISKNPNTVTQTTSTVIGYDSIEPLSEEGTYNRFVPKSPNVQFSSTVKSTTELAPYSTPLFAANKATNNPMISVNNGQTSGYYYDNGPKEQTYGNNVIKQRPNTSPNNPNVGLNQYPNQGNNGILSNNGPVFTPKTATPKDIVPNYQPNSFGYYGGNPMIMTAHKYLPQQFVNMKLDTKPEANRNNFPTVSINRDTQIINQLKPTILPPIPTPLNTFNSDQSKSEMRRRYKPERPQTEADRNAVILNYEATITPLEGFSYSFDTSNGIHMDESGTASDGVKAIGSYSYTGDDGKVYSVSYTADENGFRPVGDHLPTSPPIPEAIKEVIEQAARNRAAGLIEDGSYDESKYGHMNYLGAMDVMNYQIPMKLYQTNKNNNFKIGSRTNGKLPKPNRVLKIPINNENKNSKANDYGDVVTSDNKQFPVNQLTNRRPLNQQLYDNELRNSAPSQEFRGDTKGIPSRGQNSLRRRPVLGTKSDQQRLLKDKNSNQNNLRSDKMYSQNIADQTKAGENSLIKNGEPVEYQRERPNSLNRYNGNRNQEGPKSDDVTQIQNANVNYKARNGGANQGQPIQERQPIQTSQNNRGTQFKPQLNNEVSANAAIHFDNGYYYVPPVIKFKDETSFNQNPEQNFNNQISYITGIPTQQNVNDGFKNVNSPGGVLNQEFNNDTSGEVPPNTNIEITDSTRTPDETQTIINPNDQTRINQYNDMQKQTSSPDQNVGNEFTTRDSQDLINYMSTTTPMPSQVLQSGNQQDRFSNKFYEGPSYNSGFKQTPANSFSNRETNIPFRPSGSEIQEPTSTYTDGSNNGVDQQIRVDGFGRPLPTDAAQRYPDISINDSEGSYTTIIPGIEGPGFNDLGRIFGGPNELTIPIYDEFSTPNSLLPENSFTGPFINTDFKIPTLIDADGNPKSLNSILNELGITGILPELTTPVYNDGPIVTERIIGEDFSGPKQPQRFDPETGYHYK